MTGIDLHLHTTYDHGVSTPEEMVNEAIEKRMDCLGICVHAHDAANDSWVAKRSTMVRLLEEVGRLREKYTHELWILAGAEADYFCDCSLKGFDYVIGSVHWFEFDGAYYPVDQSAEGLRETAERFTGGDLIALAEKYYEMVGSVVEKTGADIIGHFDLITKFNEGGKLFDEQDPRYKAAWKAAADKLLKTGKPFEINTGAMSRGYRLSPYPSKEIRDYLHENGGKLLLSSDAHSKDHLMHMFEQYEAETDPEAYDFLQEL